MKFLSMVCISVFLVLNSCNSKPSVKNINKLDSISEVDGFIDLPFTIVDKTRSEDYIKYTIQAVAKSDTLELVVYLKEHVPAGYVNGVPKNIFLREGIIFESSGTKSDKLLRMLAGKFGIKSNTSMFMKKKQVFTCANLNQQNTNHKNGTSGFKIFIEDNNCINCLEQQNSAELFVNFDFDKNTIHLSEKDPEYRNELIRLMQQ